MKLATFDIFDTTLVRKCGAPATVFELAARRLWPDDSMRRCEFVNLRVQNAAKGGRNVTLTDIYAAGGMESFNEYSTAELAEAEMAVESEMLTVNPMIKEKIAELRREGWTIKFLSDMYLPSDFLSEMLVREGCLVSGEEVIVSCEWGGRKDDGSLYRKVRERYNPREWIHFGDNARSDVDMARRVGVKAEKVQTPFSPIERKLIAMAPSRRDGWRLGFLAGIARSAAVSHGMIPAARLAADYVAALYVPYVVWLLRQARKRGIKRLHFLSRDGYIMMKIAEALGVQDIELNYLFVSRKALMRAYLKEDGARRFVEITDRRTLVMQSVDELLKRLQLNRGSLEKEYGIAFDYNKILTPAQEKDFLDKIFSHPRFSPELYRRFSADAALTETYLRQEGLEEDVAQAMVDIGWLGTSRLMITRITGRNIPTFYVGARGDVYGRECGDFETYFGRNALDTRATALIENYFSASPWPSTTGYARKDETGEIVPCFKEGEQYTQTETVKINTEVCREVAENLRPYLDILDDDLLMTWAAVSLDSISNIKEEVNLTPLTVSADFDGVPMARRLSPVQLANMALTGARYTAFDRASVELSLGRRMGRWLWKQHLRSAGMREKLYKGLIRLKNR
ncbi:MAG: hypothetical protein K2O24_04725 [Muribaculaceae bacterium]|nr:hypothetical protein [Muribaculaceae bacterium]